MDKYFEVTFDLRAQLQEYIGIKRKPQCEGHGTEIKIQHNIEPDNFFQKYDSMIGSHLTTLLIESGLQHVFVYNDFGRSVIYVFRVPGRTSLEDMKNRFERFSNNTLIDVIDVTEIESPLTYHGNDPSLPFRFNQKYPEKE